MGNSDMKVFLDSGGKTVVDSLSVASIVGREHKNVLRDISKICREIKHNPKLSAVDFFELTDYKDSAGRRRPRYLVTKKGCELYATRMTGIKGTLFAANYIDAFNALEDVCRAGGDKSYKRNLRELIEQLDKRGD